MQDVPGVVTELGDHLAVGAGARAVVGLIEADVEAGVTAPWRARIRWIVARESVTWWCLRCQTMVSASASRPAVVNA